MSEHFENDPNSIDVGVGLDEELTSRHIDRLRDLVAAEDADAIKSFLEDTHPADIADLLEQLPSADRQKIAEIAPDILTPSVLAELEDEILEDILPLLGDRQITKAVVAMDSDDATQLIEELDDERRADVLAALPARDRQEVEASFAFDDETAGRLMQREFVAAPEFWTTGQTIDHMRTQYGKGDAALPDLFFDVYVIDAGFHPIGYVPLSRLVCADRKTALKDIMQPIPVLIEPETDQEDVAYLFEKYDLISAPVIDTDGRLTGMITVDDMFEVIQDEHKEDMLALAGVSDAGLADTALTTVKARAPWLLLNLFTAICASFVISLFQGSIEKLVALAVLMPIVASMGGNTGTQALTVAIRALTTRDLTSTTALRTIKREALAAIINGLIFAVILGLITFVWFKNADLSFVIAGALVFNLLCAGLAGILVPLGLKKLGADPAVASSVFVTTVTDMVGFFVFLGMASVFLL
ncbi:MAG TPA: magnesium transporter [Hellea balneolensis]|uniref:Magnesium transporter MgtE n=1 Tax=Hellea balneolensis TaxID=287478 RepID=A0A7C5QNP4_9PROT|nr:magnesium transporter [Hellea balneolensis]